MLSEQVSHSYLSDGMLFPVGKKYYDLGWHQEALEILSIQERLKTSLLTKFYTGLCLFHLNKWTECEIKL
jgi:hypothetical protein